jgi:hypothetical protein
LVDSRFIFKRVRRCGKSLELRNIGARGERLVPGARQYQDPDGQIVLCLLADFF